MIQLIKAHERLHGMRKVVRMIMISFVIVMAMGNHAEAKEGQTRIQFILLASTTDAILLESNGHYGMGYGGI